MSIQVAVRNLSKRYGAVQAVSAVGFTVGAGEIFGLLGPNGAGKTTTVESIVGLTDPDDGAIEICGIDARARPRAAKGRIGAALQSTGLQGRITPREALDLFGHLYHVTAVPVALLDRFGLAAKADTAFDALSDGQKQRLALALAFVGDPEVIVLDEPSAGLDPRMRRDLHDHVREMRREGRAVLLTTQDMDEAERLCDRIAVIDGGRIVAEGSPRALIAGSRSAMRVSVQTDASPDRPAIADLPDMSEIACDAEGVRFTAINVNRALAALIAALDMQGIAITAVKAGRATLEEVILEITGPGRRD